MSRIWAASGPREFELDDEVSFLYEDELLYGTVVRVYNTRFDYHVLVGNTRYEVNLNDDMQRA